MGALASLLQPAGGRLFAVMDAAVNDELVDRLYDTPDLAFECLSEGDVDADEFHLSPFVVDLSSQPGLLDWLLGGWGKAWGIYLTAQGEVDDVYRHLRQFLRVRSADGSFLRFRFYDPRVFRVAVPLLSLPQQTQLLGPLLDVTCEGLQPADALRFALGPAGLIRSSTRLA